MLKGFQVPLMPHISLLELCKYLATVSRTHYDFFCVIIWVEGNLVQWVKAMSTVKYVLIHISIAAA